MNFTNLLKNKRGKYISLSLFCILLLLSISTIFAYINTEKKEAAFKKLCLEQLSSGSYDSIFLAMFPIDNYSAEDFTTYLGINTLLSPYTISNLSELSLFLDTALSTDNAISHIYLGIDPYLIWTSSKSDLNSWNDNLNQYLLAYIDNYPDTTFEILLPHPSIAYWLDLKEKDMDTVLTTYRTLVCTLEPYANTTVFFPGAEHWLIANPGNYTDLFTTNNHVSQKIMLLTFCDQRLQISADNIDSILESFKALISEEQKNAVSYPDKSDLQIVFLGDSIFGNFTGSTSIPGVVSGLTNADNYNFGVGGTQATYDPLIETDFLHTVDKFISQELSVTRDETTFPHTSSSTQEQELWFVIHYGLNDYFTGQPISDPDDSYSPYRFSGALRTGISQLKNAYPQAEILLLTPPYCSYYSGGTEINSNTGGVLTDYVDAVIQVADEMNVHYLNNYAGLGINADNHHVYLSDGCHLNETGRFLAATHIIEYICNH